METDLLQLDSMLACMHALPHMTSVTDFTHTTSSSTQWPLESSCLRSVANGKKSDQSFHRQQQSYLHECCVSRGSGAPHDGGSIETATSS